jgi:hypothetical protein
MQYLFSQEFQCELCHERFMNYQSVKQHYTWRHKNEPFPKRFSYVASPHRTLTGNATLASSEQHTEIKTETIDSKSNPPPFQYDPRDLGNLTQYFEMVDSPTDDIARFKCKICAKLLIDRHGLSEHIDAHFAGKPFSCSKCGESFAGEVSLVEHIQKLHPAEN